MPLPVRTMPRSHESFASWFDRLAAAHGVGVGDLLDHGGLARTPSGGMRLWGVWLSEDDLHNVSWMSSVPQGVLWTTLLADYSHGALCCDLDLAHVTSPTAASRVAAKAWASFRGTRACPDCVANTSLWSKSWKLATKAACTEHDKLLVDRCPACLTQYRQGSPHRSVPTYPSLVPVPEACDNPHPETGQGRSRRCAHPLSEVKAKRLDPNDEGARRILDAQALHDAASTRSRLLVLDGRPATTHYWFMGLRDLTALANCLFDLDDLGPLPQPVLGEFDDYVQKRDRLRAKGEAAPGYRQPPKNALHTAALLPTVVEALEATDLAEAIEPFVAAASASGRARWRTLHETMCESEDVRNAWDRAVGERWRFSEMATYVKRGRKYRIEPSQLPHLAPEGAYDSTFAELLPGTAKHTGRLFIGLSVARVVTGSSWPVTAVELGIDATKAHRCYDVVSRRVEQRRAFWDAVHALAQALDEGPYVEYEARRWALRDLVEVPAKAWAEMCRAEGVHPGRTEARRRNAAAWVWAELAGSEWRWSPAMAAAEAAGARRDSLRDDYGRFVEWLPEGLAMRTVGWAKATFLAELEGDGEGVDGGSGADEAA